MVIENNKMVTLHYILRDGSESGQVIEDTHASQPITFTFGVGQMIPGFEKHLKGKNQGDSYAFLLAPGEAYGDNNAKAIVKVPKKNFADQDGNINEKDIQLGSPVRMKNQNGQSFQGIIKEVFEDEITVDFNHPMAGRTLHFSGEILEVKDPVGLE